MNRVCEATMWLIRDAQKVYESVKKQGTPQSSGQPIDRVCVSFHATSFQAARSEKAWPSCLGIVASSNFIRLSGVSTADMVTFEPFDFVYTAGTYF
jgi:hypothetical protein